MKPHFTKTVIIVGLIYIFIWVALIYFWDFIFKLQWPLFSNSVVGILTIGGGFLLAWWLIDSETLRREKVRELDHAKQEIERKIRIISILKMFKRSLLPWIFDYACMLSGHFSLYDSHKIYNENYLKDIPELEDIFGIGSWTPDGKQLRGTEKGEIINKEVLEWPLLPQNIYNHLNYGLRSLLPIEKQFLEFPRLIDEIDPNVAKIVHIQNDLNMRIEELNNWENKNKDILAKNIDTAVKSNLRKAGRNVLDVIIAINANIDKLTSEIQAQP